METTIIGYIHWGFIGIMEKKMEITPRLPQIAFIWRSSQDSPLGGDAKDMKIEGDAPASACTCAALW